ncbi:MAG: flavodoxin family protein [Desulfotalea sp.]
MKITLLQGGAKKKGNTAKVLSFVEDELLAMGHEVNTIYLHSKTLKGCVGCTSCKQKPLVIGCIQNDDMEEVLTEVIDSQAVVFSSPLYFWGVNSQLKAVIDRTYSLYTKDSSLVEGQRQAILVSGAGPYENNAEEAFTAFSRMQKYHKSIHAGELYVGGCTVPDELSIDIKSHAKAFARNLVG